MNARSNTGFTLIELMIVVGIIAILAGLAWPSYQESVRKGRRAEARVALNQLMLAQERYMTQTGAYAAFAAGAGNAGAAVFKTYSGDSATSAAYDLAAAACPAPNNNLRMCVQLTAQPRQADPAAGNLWMLSTGTKGCSGTDPKVCW
ncbi:MAG: type IV pilin protein [Rhodoferax sp.]|nr:type IV pilin protein [Rhodoferax sp.]